MGPFPDEWTAPTNKVICIQNRQSTSKKTSNKLQEIHDTFNKQDSNKKFLEPKTHKVLKIQTFSAIFRVKVKHHIKICF